MHEQRELSDRELETLLRAPTWYTPSSLPVGLDETIRAQGQTLYPRILRLLRQELERRQQRRWATAASAVLMVTALLYFFGRLGPAAWLGFWLTGLVSAAVLIYNVVPSRLQQNAVQALSQTEDTHVVGPLLELLFAPTLSIRALAREGLTRLLPRLSPTSSGPLGDTHLDMLKTQLDAAHGVNARVGKEDSALLVAMLEAVGQIGDRRFLETVYTLMFCDAATQTETAVREAALRCFARLDARMDYGSVVRIGSHVKFVTSGQQQPYAYTVSNVFALRGLIHLLPHVGRADASVLTRAQWELLYEVLAGGVHESMPGITPGRPAELLLAILDMAERLEDTRALRAVRLLAAGDAATPDAQRVRARAREILPLLEAKAQREEAGQTLLRASEAPVSADTLLRPAEAAPSETAPQELLRPGATASTPAAATPVSAESNEPKTLPQRRSL
jgi:hypothetical protein